MRFHTGMIATLAVVIGLVVPAVATAQTPDHQQLSKRRGCHTLTARQCNAKRSNIHRAGYPMCNTWACARRVEHKRQTRVRRQRQREWHYWTTRYIPPCTWVGESGPGPQFASWRYTKPNSGGSGALGKYQMMPGTYHAYAKYHDWSELDQEIAGHRLYWAQGTAPWSAC